MPSKAYLVSFLTNQSLLLKERFAERYPHAWLVWEPGDWKSVKPAEQSSAKTRVPSPSAPPPGKGDALCFELAVTKRPATLVVGRGPECDVVLNDATVSRAHLQMSLSAAGAWSVQPAQGSSAVTVDGVALVTAWAFPLDCGRQIRLGDVLLTFLDQKGLLDRIAREAERVTRAATSR